MIINATNLGLLFEGVKLAYNKGWDGAETAYERIAMTVPSATSKEQYGWLNQIPDIREWVGDRVVNNLITSGHTIENRDWEQTIGVPRNSIEDDTFGIFGPLYTEMGRRTREFPDRLVFDLLAGGFTGMAYDGQNFFDTDHPVIEGGVTSNISNMQAGAGEPWYLFDTSKAVKPLIYQLRKPFEFVAKTQPGDDSVFFRKQYLYGVDGRSAAGYGLWQLAFASRATLDATNYGLARAAMTTMVGDESRKLGIKPTLLICGPNNEEKARKLLTSEHMAGGESNPWKGTVELLVSPWVG